MSGTTENVFWKQPIIYLILLLTGAGGALMGERWIEKQSLLSSEDNSGEAIAQVPTPSEQKKEVSSVNSASWF
ncbi:MAG: serine protease, partial [Cyanobacteriota bacterium]|nr:serine protease [Cyanobacteriota bacterium]